MCRSHVTRWWGYQYEIISPSAGSHLRFSFFWDLLVGQVSPHYIKGRYILKGDVGNINRKGVISCPVSGERFVLPSFFGGGGGFPTEQLIVVDSRLLLLALRRGY